MAEEVTPSTGVTIDPIETGEAIKYGGASNGFVQDGSNPTLAGQESSLTHNNFNEFAQSSSGSSLDVTIDAGEGFVQGTWFAIDTSTTVSLASSTNGQSVYAGFDLSTGDDVLVGRDAAFDSSDPKIELFQFNTDGSGVTSVTDVRQIGHTIHPDFLGANLDVDSNDITNAALMASDVFAVVESGSQPSTNGEMMMDTGDVYVYSGGALRNFSSIGSGSSVTEEDVEDIVAAMVASDSNLSWSYDDPNGTLTISLSGSIQTSTIENDDYRDNVSSASVSGNTTIDITSSNFHDHTLTGDVTYSFSTGASSPYGGNSFSLVLTQDATGGHSVTWPASVTWMGIEPAIDTSASTPTLVTFTTPDGGSTWYGVGASDAGTGGGGGGGFDTQTTVTSNYTASDAESIWVDTSSQVVTVSLPTPGSGGEVVRVKHTTGSNDCDVSPSGTETIDDLSGGSNFTIAENNSYTFESDGTNWETH